MTENAESNDLQCRRKAIKTMYRLHSFPKLILGATLILGVWACSTGLSPTNNPPTVSENQAWAAALAQVPGGTVDSAGLETENARKVWSFDIATPGSKDLMEVQLDANTGRVASRKSETPEAEAKEAALEKGQK